MKYILLAAFVMLLFSCSRKVHTQRTETSSSDTQASYVDSIKQVNKTLSEAYEELLKTSNSTGVVFESVPCDSGKIGGAGMPHVIIRPDGSKEFSGPIKSYRDDNETTRQISSLRKENESLKEQLNKKDTSHHEQSSVVVVRNVRSTFIPVWMWVVLFIAGALWLNERFRFITIPFLNRKK